MYQNKMFIYTSSLLLAPIITTSCSNESQPTQNDQPVPEFEIDDADKFFPKMDIESYYSYIEFENHIPIISDELIKIFIKDVLKKVATSKGKIFFTVNKISKQNVEINFKWEYKSKILYKTYKICINTINTG